MASRRLTVGDAADALGISANAVRMRVRRGSLASDKDAEGRVWVLVGPDEHAGVFDQHATDQPTNEVVEELREQNAYLRGLLDAEREARTEENRRKDHIIAGLVQRVPELEAAQESPPEQEPHEDSEDSPQEPPQGSDGEGTRPGLGERLRRWWRG